MNSRNCMISRAAFVIVIFASTTANKRTPASQLNNPFGRLECPPRRFIAFTSAAATHANWENCAAACKLKLNSHSSVGIVNVNALRHSCAAVLTSGEWGKNLLKRCFDCFGGFVPDLFGRRSKNQVPSKPGNGAFKRFHNAVEMLNSARSRGVYLFVDRRIFSSKDIWNMNTFMRAVPRNAAVEYIQAITADGMDGSRALHKAKRKPDGALTVSYETSVGPIHQSGLHGFERYNNTLITPTESGDPTDSGAEGAFRYRARVMYDGANYNGWQLQQSRPSIQGLLETVIGYRLQRPVRVVGAGRTDSGVHARGQAIHFDTGEEIGNVSRFEHSLNMMLPRDVRLCNVEAATERVWVESAGAAKRWHAIYSAKGKIYAYRIYIGATLDPLQRLFRHHEYRACDIGLLREAAARFEGTHDFSAFANQNLKGGAAQDPVRTVHKVEVIDEGEGNFRLEFNLDGALYKMVRNMVGTILAVAGGRLGLEDLDGIFAGRNRQLVPTAAPAHGLCLERVFYNDFNPV